jgi:hypothetical protein
VRTARASYSTVIETSVNKKKWRVVAINCYSIKLKVGDRLRNEMKKKKSFWRSKAGLGENKISFILNTGSKGDLRCLLLKIPSLRRIFGRWLRNELTKLFLKCSPLVELDKLNKWAFLLLPWRLKKHYRSNTTQAVTTCASITLTTIFFK